MSDLFVPYKLAKLATEKGWKTKQYAGWYAGDGSGEVHYEWRLKLDEMMIGAPLYQELVDWFREKHGIWVTVGIGHTYENGDRMLCDWYINKESKHEEFGFEHITHSYSNDFYEALTKALEEAFKLI